MTSHAACAEKAKQHSRWFSSSLHSRGQTVEYQQSSSSFRRRTLTAVLTQFGHSLESAAVPADTRRDR
jgi:hypothetical protein